MLAFAVLWKLLYLQKSTLSFIECLSGQVTRRGFSHSGVFAGLGGVWNEA